MSSLSVFARPARRPGLLRRLLLPLAASARFAGSLLAQAPEDCLACHEDDSLVAERNGVEVSAFVDPALFADSIHADLA